MEMHKVHGDPIVYGPDTDGNNLRRLPTFYISEDDLPEIKDWPVGGKYILLQHVELVEMRKEEMGPMKGKLIGRFAISKIMSIDDVSPEMFEKIIAKAKSKK